jgi:hypothetical protein
VILCLLSLVFAFRYGLTEKRTMEINELLRKKRGNGSNDGQAELAHEA